MSRSPPPSAPHRPPPTVIDKMRQGTDHNHSQPKSPIRVDSRTQTKPVKKSPSPRIGGGGQGARTRPPRPPGPPPAHLLQRTQVLSPAQQHAARQEKAAPKTTSIQYPWEEFWDEEVEASYYFNHVTKEATWDLN
ncbi:unnamed protein product [Chrysoparadoxa australica]